jgi:hypothetical protein
MKIYHPSKYGAKTSIFSQKIKKSGKMGFARVTRNLRLRSPPPKMVPDTILHFSIFGKKGVPPKIWYRVLLGIFGFDRIFKHACVFLYT